MSDTPSSSRAMPYRRLGRSGLKVSVLSFGSWVTFGNQLDTGAAKECLAAAYDGGVNFFDNAEAYAGGESERIMGAGHRRARLGRGTLRDLDQGLLGHPRRRVNMREHAQPQVPDAGDRRLARAPRARLRRPPLLPPARSRTRRSRRRCGRCPTSSSSGKALYWGTSEWTADEIRAAWDIAERHHLHKPVMEQPQYNLFERRRVEQEYARLYDDIGLGPHHLEPARVGPAHRQVPRRHPRGQPGRAARLRVAARTCSPTRRRNDAGRASWPASPTSSAARCRSSPSPGARRTRTSRP